MNHTIMALIQKLISGMELQSQNEKLLKEIVLNLANRVALMEQVLLVTRPSASPPDIPFSVIANGYRRELEAGDFGLTPKELADIEAEIQAQQREEDEC